MVSRTLLQGEFMVAFADLHQPSALLEKPCPLLFLFMAFLLDSLYHIVGGWQQVYSRKENKM